MNNKNVYVIALFALTLILSSCSKPGCTDQDAKNFDSNANEEDGSCLLHSNTELISMNKWNFSTVYSTDDSLQIKLNETYINCTYEFKEAGELEVLFPDSMVLNQSLNWEFSEDETQLVIDKGLITEIWFDIILLEKASLAFRYTDPFLNEELTFNLSY